MAIPRRLILGALTVYRYALSPLMGPRCRFEPSCSAYASDSVSRFGAIRGGWLGIKRVCKCHPWHPGGYDPVPPPRADSIVRNNR